MTDASAGDSSVTDTWYFADGSWIRWHNEHRPHQALGYPSPQRFRAQQLEPVA